MPTDRGRLGQQLRPPPSVTEKFSGPTCTSEFLWHSTSTYNPSETHPISPIMGGLTG
jgi:hypothetical protein